MVTADVYLRISADLAGQGLGVERQEQDARKYIASKRGWRLGVVHVDNDVSASRYGRKPRHGYRALLDRIRDRECDRVVVWDIDRLLRQPAELEALIDVVEHSTVEVHNLMGEIDLRSSDGRFVARILVAKAAKEADDVSRRARRKKQQLADHGLPSGGGRRPFGWEPDRMTHRADEAEALRAAAAGVLAGDSLSGIVRRWNAEGPPAVGGGVWRVNALWKALTSPRNAGLREHQGKVVGDAAWPAILDRVTYERVRAILTDPSRRSNTNARRYLLSGGLITCGRCGNRLAGKPAHSGKPSYHCTAARGGCGRTYIIAKPVERLVVADVLVAVDEGRIPGGGQDDGAAARELVARLEEGRADLAEQLARDEISRMEWARMRKVLTARIEDAQRQIVRRSVEAVRPWLGQPGALAAAWGELPLERKRAVIATYIDRVVINPPSNPGSHAFEERRVDPVWIE